MRWSLLVTLNFTFSSAADQEGRNPNEASYSIEMSHSFDWQV